MKKKKIIWLFPLIITGLLFVLSNSCKKDKDDNEETKNHFKVGGEYTELGDGVLLYYGEDDWYEGYNFDLYLVSTGIEGDAEGCTGSGVLIYYELFSSSSTSLANGDYLFDDQSDICPEGTFDEAFYSLDYDCENDEGSSVEFVSGKLVVNKSGSDYILNISGKDEYGNNITGYYKGPLTKYDEKKAAELKSRKL
jgi:hypothetical protein